MDKADDDVIRRFFPDGPPDPSKVTEKEVRRVLEQVDASMREKSASFDASPSESYLLFKHTF